MSRTTASFARLRRAARYPHASLTRAATAAAMTASLLLLPATGATFGFEPRAPMAEAAAQTCPRVLVRGDHGADVENLQRRLNRAFVEINKNPAFAFPPLSVDAIYGKKTEERVVAYQQIINDIPDAVVGPETWHALGAC
jgi:peptidoglycan hydrolase-like protein with peptidoglycan-binding domain